MMTPRVQRQRLGVSSKNWGSKGLDGFFPLRSTLVLVSGQEATEPAPAAKRIKFRTAKITPDMSPGTVARVEEERRVYKREQSRAWHAKWSKKGVASP